MAERQYELILYGATGYTGKYTAEFLQENAPTDLNWAIAGRNAQKLEAIGKELKELNKDRSQPAIETIKHELEDLKKLAGKTKVLISTVGPYWQYGTPVVEACVAAKTHYLDVTGEVPWVYDMINRFHAQAQASKTILLLQCGIDSVPSDLLAWSLARYIRDTYHEGTDTCVTSIQSINGTLSGGTASTALSISSAYPIATLLKSMKPFALSPILPSSAQNTPPAKRSLLEKVLGYVNVRDLGYLTAWPGAPLDRAIVHRSWGLFGGPDGLYGGKFRFELLFRARSALLAIAQAFSINLLGILMLIPPGRWLLARALHKAGDGADRETASKYFIKYKAVATSDGGKRVAGKLNLMKSPYYFTGVFVGTAALEILRGDGKSKAVREGGVVTSATLEGGYKERLEKVGATVEVAKL